MNIQQRPFQIAANLNAVIANGNDMQWKQELAGLPVSHITSKSYFDFSVENIDWYKRP